LAEKQIAENRVEENRVEENRSVENCTEDNRSAAAVIGTAFTLTDRRLDISTSVDIYLHFDGFL